jgi:hypothetical protein
MYYSLQKVKLQKIASKDNLEFCGSVHLSR